MIWCILEKFFLPEGWQIAKRLSLDYLPAFIAIFHSTTPAGAAAAFFRWLVDGGHTAQFLGEAVSVFGGEIENDLIGFDGDIDNRILGDDVLAVFNFHGKVFMGEDGATFFEDGSHLAGGNAMIFIAADPGLELAGFIAMQGATAIEEGLLDMPYFGDVEGDRHLIAGRQEETEGFVGVLGQGGFEFEESHGIGGG